MTKIFFRFSSNDQILFAKRLSILLKGGVPIVESLQMLRQQSNRKGYTEILNNLIVDIENGKLLSVALSKYENFFGRFAINIIRVGEATGTLHENLFYLAEELKKRRHLKKKIISALVYPGFIVVATFGISGLLMLYVFPKILPVFKSFRFPLPWTTRALIVISNILSQHLFFLLAVIGLLFIGTTFALRVPRISFLWDVCLLKIPFLGQLFQNYFLANICRTLGLLLASNVRIVDAARIAGSTTPSLVYRKQIFLLASSITTGDTLTKFLDNQRPLFPPMFRQMVAVGEKTGNLSGSFLYLGEIYEQEVDDLTKNLSSLIEPVLMVFMGLVVGFVAISIITPIYEITQNLHP